MGLLMLHNIIMPMVSCTSDTQGTHSNMETADVGPARSDNNAQQQRNPLRRQLNPPVMSHF